MMIGESDTGVVLNHPPAQQRSGKLRVFAVVLGIAAAACIFSVVKPSGRETTGAFLAQPLRTSRGTAPARAPASQMADFPWEEGFQWPWEKKAEPVKSWYDDEERLDREPEAEPADEAPRGGASQMRAPPPQMMADFPWEEGFQWPWEKKEEEPAQEEPVDEAPRAGEPEAEPADEAPRGGASQMRAPPPQMMADFPWEEGFKWPWEKTEEKLTKEEPAGEVESPEPIAEEPEPSE